MPRRDSSLFPEFGDPTDLPDPRSTPEKVPDFPSQKVGDLRADVEQAQKSLDKAETELQKQIKEAKEAKSTAQKIKQDAQDLKGHPLAGPVGISSAMNTVEKKADEVINNAQSFIGTWS